MLVLFVDAIKTNNVCVDIDIGRLHVKKFLKLIVFSNTVLPKKIVVIMRVEASANLRLVKLTRFVSSHIFNILKIGTERVWQVLRASPAAASYAEEEPRVHGVRYTLFHVGPSSIAITVGVDFYRRFSPLRFEAYLLR